MTEVNYHVTEAGCFKMKMHWNPLCNTSKGILRSDNVNVMVRAFIVTSPLGLLYGFYVVISFMLLPCQLFAYY